MIPLLICLAFGFGVLLVFDGLTRERPRKQTKWLTRASPVILGALGGGAAGLLATGWVTAGLTGAAIGSLAPRILNRRRTERTRAVQREAIAEVSARLRDAVRAGLGLTEGLALVAKNAPDGIRDHLSDLAGDARTVGLARAANRFTSALDDPLADLFARALVLADRHGSTGVTDVLDGLAESASGLALTTREIRAKQSHQRASAKVVSAVPVALLLAIRFTNPEYLAPYRQPSGQLVLAFGFLLIAVGYSLMTASARLPEPARERHRR